MHHLAGVGLLSLREIRIVDFPQLLIAYRLSQPMSFTGPADQGGALVHVKVVPGASRSRIAGLLGDRLRVQIAAPAERGKANAALLSLLAEKLGCRSGELRVVRGHTSPQKSVHIPGRSPTEVERCLQP